MSGSRRLDVFWTTSWVVFWLVAYAVTIPKWGGFVLVGIGPPVLAWGIWWVWRGFRRK